MATRSGTGTSLLVVDVQVGVMRNAWDRDRVLANVAIAVGRAREAGIAVVWVQHHDPELPLGSPAWQFVPGLDPLPSECRIDKSHHSAFEDTALLAALDRLGVGRVLLAGAATNWCIRATAYGALDRGFDVTLLSDAHTTEDMVLAPGHVVRAESMVDDLNVAMRWLSYPGRRNASAGARDVEFIRVHP